MKKIIASILAAFFVVLSPIFAYASTTEQFISLMSAASSDIQFYAGAGYYNLNNDTYNLGYSSEFSFSNGESIPFGEYGGVNYYNDSLNLNYAPVYSFRFGNPGDSSPAICPDGSTLRITLNSIGFQVRTSANTLQYNLYHDNASPYRVFAKLYFRGMKQVGSTHTPTFHEQIQDISPFLKPTSYPVGNPYSVWYDMDLSLPLKADPLPEDSGIDRVYGLNLTYLELFVVYDFSQFRNGSNEYLINDTNFVSGSRFRVGTMFNPIPNSVIRLTYESDLSGNSDTGMINSINSSINSLQFSVNNSISSLSNKVTQSTNTITTKIDTMGNDIKTGLQNVVQSAQQNTQNIINTVTTKVNEVKTGITEVKDSILDLPNKIQEMLLGLIVPDSDTMANKYSEFSGLLEQKLGVIYQIPVMLFDFFDTIVNAATTPQSTLTLPAFQLPWIDGSTLTVWQPMEYKIIPDGMQVLSDLIKTITSMTVVVLTFNSVKRAYERFLRS